MSLKKGENRIFWKRYWMMGSEREERKILRNIGKQTIKTTKGQFVFIKNSIIALINDNENEVFHG